MQPASGDLALSPVTPRGSDEHRTLDSFTTIKLSIAIDALRHEGEAILWEMNSLKTHNITLEQRIIGQTEELEVIARNLAALQDQHRIMEQQYEEKLRAIRSELRSARERLSSTSAQSTSASTSVRKRYRSPPMSESPRPYGSQDSFRYLMPQPPSLPPPPDIRVPGVSISRRDHTQDMGDCRRDVVDGVSSLSHSTVLRRSSTPPLVTSPRPLSSHSSYVPSRHSPQGNYNQQLTHSHQTLPLDVASPIARHQPSLSPSATMVGTDAPSCLGPHKSQPYRF